MNYPECEKLIIAKNSEIKDFIDWMKQEGYVLCKVYRGELRQTYNTTTIDLLGAFFSIDMDKVEEEKKKILELIGEGWTFLE